MTAPITAPPPEQELDAMAGEIAEGLLSEAFARHGLTRAAFAAAAITTAASRALAGPEAQS